MKRKRSYRPTSHRRFWVWYLQQMRKKRMGGEEDEYTYNVTWDEPSTKHIKSNNGKSVQDDGENDWYASESPSGALVEDKLYWEIKVNKKVVVGLTDETLPDTNQAIPGTGIYTGVSFEVDGTINIAAPLVAPGPSFTWSNKDVIGFALDLDSGKFGSQ